MVAHVNIYINVQKNVERKVCLTAKMLQDKIEEIKGAVMICYPMGLPKWDAMRLILEGEDEGVSAVRPCDCWVVLSLDLQDCKLYL
jgi:hypothetical protein